MIRITVVQQGRLKDPQVEALCAEYRKRLTRFAQVKVVEIEPKGDAPLWPPSARWKVACDERGEAIRSEELAKRIERWAMAHGEIAFAIGAADTLHPPTRASADAALSLSTLTLPHQLAHLILIEQLYRAATILAGTGYHRP